MSEGVEYATYECLTNHRRAARGLRPLLELLRQVLKVGEWHVDGGQGKILVPVELQPDPAGATASDEVEDALDVFVIVLFQRDVDAEVHRAGRLHRVATSWRTR